jgi:cytochrome c-type biogenesis protein CcmH/NrfG
MITSAPRKAAVLFLCALPLCALLSIPLAHLAADTVDKLPVDKLIEQDHWKRARGIVSERLRANPNDARSNYWYSKIAENFNDLDGAMPPAEKAVSLDGATPDYHAQLAEIYALMAQKAGLLKQISYVRKLRREVDAALELDHHNLDALLISTMFYWRAPALAGGDRKKALELTEEIIRVYPSWGYLAQARLFQDEDLRRTQDALEKAARVQPPNYLALTSLAEFYVTKLNPPRLTDAAKLAKVAIAQDGTRAGAYRILALVFATEEQQDELAATLVAAEKADPDDLSPYYYAAKAMLDSGQDNGSAERYLRRYLSQPPEARSPSWPEARVLLAQATRKDKGNISQAALILPPDQAAEAR